MTGASTRHTGLLEILGERLYLGYPLAPLTSLKIGGPAECFAVVNTCGELRRIREYALNEGVEMRILGRGTNLLIQDGPLSGMVVQLSGEFKGLQTRDNSVEIGGGTPLALLLKEAIRKNLTGVEILAGIPGTLGGAIVMNAGTKGGSIGDLIEDVQILTKRGTVVTKGPDEMGLSYRRSCLEEGSVILGARLKLTRGPNVKDAITESLHKRWMTQPYRERSAGCVFKNPGGQCAGKLIDDAGLKGYRHGGIEVSRKHANFFINLGGGTASDFLHLMETVQGRIYQIYKIQLETEIRMWVN